MNLAVQMARGTICRAFVGRDNELAELRRCYHLAASGRSVTVVLSGDAGVGKSRLVAEFLRSLRDDRPHVAIGYAHDSAQAPFAPFLEALHRLPPATSARWSRENPLLDGPAQRALSAESVQGEKLRRFVGTAELLRDRAESRPIVLAIEDAHWADLATLELLHYLARSAGPARVFVLITQRTEEPGRMAQYARLTMLARDAEAEVHLPPLRSDEMQRLFSTVIAQRRIVPVDTLRRIEELTEGRPFVAEELLRSVLDSRGHHAGVPISLKASILARAEQLPPTARDVLIYAAAIGRRFDALLVATLLERELPAVLDILRKARDLQLVVEETHGEYAFSFRHALTREVLYGGLLAAQSRSLHAKIAQHLESTGTRDAATLPLLAYHAWAARDGPKALAYNIAAGENAAAMLAHSDAAHFFDRALTFSLPSAATAELFERLARIRYMSGEVEGTRDALERSLALHGSEPPNDKTVELLGELARLEYILGNIERSKEFCGQLLGHAQRVPHGPGRMLAHVQLAANAVHSGHAAEALEFLAGVEPSEERDRSDTLGRFYGLRAYARCLQGRLDEALTDYDRALAIAERSGEPGQLLRVKNNIASRAAMIGDLVRSESLYVAALALAEQLRHAKLGTLLAHSYASICFTLGRYKDARRLFERGLSHGTGAVTERVVAASVALRLGLVELDDDLLSVNGNEEIVELAFASCETQNIANAAGTFVALLEHLGRPAEAAALRRRAMAMLPNTDFAFWLLDAVARSGEADEIERARGLLELAARAPQDRTAGAYLALFRARTARRADRADDAFAAASDAVRRFTELAWPLETGWSLEEAGRPREALGIYCAIGAVRDARRLEAIVPGGGGGEAGPLTRRERQVAQLVADGRTNREIAAQLSISERTVEAHLASVFARYGVRTRLALATRLLSKNSA